LHGSSLIITKAHGDKGQNLSAFSAEVGIEIARYLTKNVQIIDARLAKIPSTLPFPHKMPLNMREMSTDA